MGLTLVLFGYLVPRNDDDDDSNMHGVTQLSAGAIRLSRGYESLLERKIKEVGALE
jgi:hypothetical protein